VRGVFHVLARLKFLRGTAFDVFGYTDERRTERALIVAYENDIALILQNLRAETHALAINIAALPDGVRGFGHVKAQHLARVQTQHAELMIKWQMLITPVAQAA
jgi:indolepyruvate ferredoxin oxidoreductase